MKSLEELIKARTAAIKKAEAIQAGAETMERELNDDEVAKVNSLMTEVEELDVDIEKIEARQSLKTKLASASQSLNKPLPLKTGGNADQPLARVEVGEPNAASDPNRGFENPRAYFKAVMESAVSKRITDDRLKLLVAPKGFDDKMATVGSDEHRGSSNPDGGFMLPPAQSPNGLLTGGGGLIANIFQMARSVPMDVPSFKVRARVDKNHSSSVTGGLKFYRRGETGEATSSKSSIEQIQFEAHGLTGLTYESEELLSDSPSTYQALIADGWQQEYLAQLESEMLDGTGVGEFLGIMNSPALIAVAKETDQTAATINFKNIAKMRARCWRYSQAVWLVNQDVISQLMLMENNAGQLIWRDSANGANPPMLLGRPIYESEYCETLGTAGDIQLINPNEYLTGIYQPLKGEESIHVRFLTNEKTFRFTTRNAGIPLWRSALTPAKSTVTLSPYVSLAERA